MDSVAIVTGGSRGIGRATALAAAKRGRKVAGGYARDVSAEGIRANAICSILDTEIHASGGEPDRADRLAYMVPMNRVGTADEIADAVVWLMSNGASYVTHTIIDVSGGR